MKRIAALLLLAATVAACDDKADAKSRLLPTAPVAMATPLETLTAAPARIRGSTVCSAYLRERAMLSPKLMRSPKDTVLAKRARSLASIITDACN